MLSTQSYEDRESTHAMPTYYRPMSPNELSCFLPSRAYGLNDLYEFVSCGGNHAVRHTLMACRVEMAPGRYDDAQFVYTPPSSPRQALKDALDTVWARAHSEISGGTAAAPVRLFLSHGCRTTRTGITGVYEYHLILMNHHSVNDGVSVHRNFDMMCELLGGSATPGEAPRLHVELAALLDEEWSVRWSVPRDPGDVIGLANEDRLAGGPRSKFYEVAWRVDHQNVQRRAICKSERVTLQNAVFVLCNFAWIRLYTKHPELNASKALPMMIDVHCSQPVALPGTRVPAVLLIGMRCSGRGAVRSRSSRFRTTTAFLFHRALVTSTVRAQRAKNFAREDDEADGTLPSRPQAARPLPSSLERKAAPSAALLGLAQLGDLASVFRTDRYPALELIDSMGGGRKAPGGMMLYTRTFMGRFIMILQRDGEAFAPGLMEEFYRYVVDGDGLPGFPLARAQGKL
ncbi:hypothetical protein B0H11DRAFT_1898156 [Mycena galericulata]|nr:hypothetical protein B0H11DRAFT_1898156 [Mycena galericulata]